MQTLPGSNDKEKLDSLTALNHKEQAVWFLNAFWNSVGESNAEQVWGFKQKFDELDQEKVPLVHLSSWGGKLNGDFCDTARGGQHLG
jgi:hypothetical protein